MAATEQELLPFRLNTRQRIAKVGTIPFASGQRATGLEIPRVGFLNRIIVFLRGTMNAGAASALADLGPWQLINRLQVNVNIGSAQLIDLSGYGAYLFGSVLERAFAPDKAGIGATVPHIDNFSAPTANGNNVWNLCYILPIAANQGMNFDAGLINLQAQEVRCTLDLTFGTPADAITVVGTGFTGTAHIYYEYYELPPEGVMFPPRMLHRILEEVQPITATGDQPYTVPRMGTMLQLIHLIRTNGARSDSIDEFRLHFNKTDNVYFSEKFERRMHNRLEWGIDLPVGAYGWDFWHSSEDVSEGDNRDTINTQKITTLESIVKITTGTVIGAGNNFLHSIRRIVQELE